MLFNSIEFALFLPLVFVVYWALQRPGIRWQNLWIMASSFVFYGWWDWRFLFLLLGTSLIDYFVALALERTDAPRHRRWLLVTSVVSNLGVLGTFKYYDFFAHSLQEAFARVGITLDPMTLGLVLPVGISFYTFQALSYTVDVYRRELKAVHDPVAYLAFIAFFPQLVAGPIERATNLLPQFQRPRRFDHALAQDGLRQMLWGLFKKVVVADNCAVLVNAVYDDPGAYGGSSLLLATVFFAFQIYCDFSGYSDIAIGCARLFGFRLMRNFAFPYFSRDIAEFWRRWHISLTTWFRDYLYIPLGGSRGGTSMALRNTMIIFLVSGFWHGANWTFVAWGAVNALFFVPLLLSGSNRRHTGPIAAGRMLPSAGDLARMMGTFLLACLAWVFFRARDIGEAFTVLQRIFSGSLFEPPVLPEMRTVAYGLLGIGVMLAFEWLNRDRQHGLQMDGRWGRPVRFALYYGLIALLILMAPLGGGEFIYFQF